MEIIKRIKVTSLLALSAIAVSAQTPAKITVDNISFTDLNKNGKLEPYEDTRLPNSQRVSDLMTRLTIEDKMNLVLGTGMIGFDMLSGFDAINPIVEAKDFMVPGAAGSTMPIIKYGLPAVIMTDGPAGVRINPHRKNTSDTFYATGFPVGSLLASTWDVALVEAVGKALGNETREYGSDIQLCPALNIMRNPLCGRNYEYYSEDPIVSGKIAAAMTLGIQSNDVGVSLKHYAANNSERNRMGINAHISPRTLREIYLRGFEIAVKESDPKTIMSSYNKINGKYTSADYDLLTTILRDEWGFRGLVMTDWFGGYSDVSNLFNKEMSGEDFAINCTSEQIKAGNDLLMPGIRPQLQNLKDDLKSGKITEQELDICVRRVLNMVFESHKMKDYKYSDKPDLKAHAELTRKAASEGMVLMENKDKTLPITSGTNKLAVFGSLAYKFISGGTGSGHVNKAYTVSLIEGLTNAGYTLDKKVNDVYVPFVAKEEAKLKSIDTGLTLMPLFPQPVLKESLFSESAKSNDMAVITIGRSSGELDDRPLDGDFYLTKEEQALIDKVSAAFHAQNKKVVVVINVGAIIEMTSWKDKVDAILLAWLPGQEAGNSVADVLSGKVNPSGKLTMTIPAKYEDLSTADNFQGLPVEKPTDVTYSEGVYIGYRYFDTKKIEPAYPFGYGLSYTTFEYSNIKISDKEFGNEIFVTVDVKNTGTVAGKEVVQLYLSAPKVKLDKPEKELKAFAKTSLLKPGETQTLYFKLNPKDLASFNENASAWIADKGTYNILVGGSSRNISQRGSFNLPSERIVEKVNNVMKPDIKFMDLKL